MTGGKMGNKEMDKIRSLYEQINFIGFYCTYHKDSRYIEMAKEIIPEIDAFAQWFISEELVGITEEEHQWMNQNLLEILKDIAEAIWQEDIVLMMDALEQGLNEYLKMFLPDMEEE